MARRRSVIPALAWFLAAGLIGCSGGQSSTTSAPATATDSPRQSPEIESSATPSSGASPTVDPSASDGLITEPQALPIVHRLMLEAIVADRPLLRLDLHPDELGGSWILDGNVDDGFGSGRLYVVLTPRPGDLTARPCGDPDFRQGGRCIEEERPNGDRLVLRDRVTGGGVTSVLAVLIHPDRSAITAEASNMTIDLQAGPIGPGGPPPPVVARQAPLYTARELGALLLAIDRHLRG